MPKAKLETGAVLINGPGQAVFQTVPFAFDKETQVLVEVDACAICTAEQRVFKGTNPAYPYWGGHELFGRVASGRGFPEGTPVVVALMERCGQCIYCLAGADNHCAYLGPRIPRDGFWGPRGLSSRIAVPSYQVFAVPERSNMLEYAFAEPLACVSRSISWALPPLTKTALVIGGGTMGLLHTWLLASKGFRVILTDESAEQSRGFAAGADTVVEWKDLTQDFVLEATEGVGPSAVFCTRLGARGVEKAAETVARLGTIVLFQSIPMSQSAACVDVNALHYREIRIVGSIAQSKGDINEAITFLNEGCSPLSFLTTRVIDAQSALEAFTTSLDPLVNRVIADFRNDRTHSGSTSPSQLF